MTKKPKPLSPYAPKGTPLTYEQWAPSGGNPYIIRELSDRELINQYKEIYSASDLPTVMTGFANKFPSDPDIALSLSKAGVSNDAANAASRLNDLLGTEETYNSVVGNQRGSNIDYHDYLAALNTDDANADDVDKDDAAWFAGIKTATRVGLAGLFTPYELLGNLARQGDGAWNKARQNGRFGGDNEGQDNIIVGGDQAFDPTAIVRSTTLWQNLVEDKSMGTGFIPSGDAIEAKEEIASHVAQIRSRKTNKLSAYTPGRSFASLTGLDPEETAYSTMSGIVDAVVALRADPVVVLGRIKNAKNLEKSAQELRDAKAAGMDAEEVARLAQKHAEDTAKMIDTDALNAAKGRNLAEDELKAVYEKVSNDRIQFDQLLSEGALAAQPKSVQNAIRNSGINQQIEIRKTLLQTLEDQKKLGTGLVPDPLRDGLPMSKVDSIKYLEEEVKGIELSINQSLDSIHINRYKKVRDLITLKQAVLAERTQEFADTVRQSQKIASPAERQAFIERERAGLTKTSDGYKLNRDTAVQWMFGKNADEVLHRIADVTSPSEIMTLSKGKFAPSFAKELAAANTIDDVETLLMGRIGIDVIKSVPRNALARYVVNKNPNFIFGDPVRTVKTDKFSNTFRYLKSQLPSMGEIHLQNTDELVKQTKNWMTAARWAPKEIDGVIDNLLSTNEISYVERQNIITDMLDRTVDKYTTEQNITPLIKSQLTRFTTAYESSLSGLRQYSSEVIDEAFGNKVIIDGETIDITGLPTSIAQLANTIAFPNVARVRELTGLAARASRSVDNLISSNSRYSERATFLAARLVRNSTDGFLRSILLVGRGAFILRNIMEMQVRMYLAGGIGLFSNPVGFIGLMMSNPKSAKSLMAKVANVDPYLVDISGKAFAKMATGDAKGFQDAWNSFVNVMTERGFSMDGRAVRGAIRDGSFNLIKLEDRARNVDAYADGVASRLLLHHADPMKRMIATQSQARLPSALRVAIREGRLTYEQAMVAAVRDGLFKNQVDILTKSVPQLQKLLSTEKGIHTLLFGDGFRSYSKEIADETLGITELRNFISTGKITQSTEKVIDGKVVAEKKELLALTSDFVKNQKELSKYIKNQILNDPEMANRASQVAVPVIARIAENDNLIAFNYAKLTDAFFRTSSRLEVRTVYSPEYRVSYWNAVGDMAPLLSKEAAQRILQEAFDIRKTRVATENADGTITYEKWTKNNPAFDRIVEASKSNNGKLTYDDINEYAQDQAAKKVAKLFYNAVNKNNFSYAAQLVFPFINAWGNTLKKWGELSANPANAAARVTPAVRVFENLQSSESADIYDITGTAHDPAQGFIWEDQYGEKVFTIPLSGNLKTLFGLIGGDPRSGDISIPVSSLNLAFSGAHIPGSSIGILPGVGTVWNLSYSILDNDIKKNVPEVLANWIAPYGDKTGNVLAPAPAWLTKIIRGSMNDEAAFVKLSKPIMVWEATNNPEFRPLYDGTPLSLEDRAALQEKLAARGMSGARYQYIMQGILQNVSPGTPVYQYYAKNENGDTFMQWQMQEAFNKIVGANNGNYDLAWNEYSTVFGREAVMAAMGQTKDAVFANNEAWEFAKKHQGLFDSYNGVIPYFFTGGDFSTEYKRSMERRGRGDVLTAKELTTEADKNVLAAVRGNLAVEAVNNGYSAEWIDSQMQKYKMDVLQGYEPEISVTSNKTEQKILQIKSALTHEEFSTTAAGSAALSYFSARDQALADSKMFYPDRNAPSLSGNDNAENRNWLRQVADQLSQGNPDFKNMYQRVLSQELREK